MATKKPERSTALQIKMDKLRKALNQGSELKYIKRVTLQVEVTYYDQGALPPCSVRTTTENGVRVHYEGASAVDALAQMAVQIGSTLDLQRWIKDGLKDICSREDGHTGPCNGHPRLNCPGA